MPVCVCAPLEKNVESLPRASTYLSTFQLRSGQSSGSSSNLNPLKSPTEEETNHFLDANGLRIEDLREELARGNFFIIEKIKDKKSSKKEKRTFRWQRHVSKAKIKIPYIKFMIMECLLEGSEKWNLISQAFITPGNVRQAGIDKDDLAKELSPLLKEINRNLMKSGINFRAMLTDAKLRKAEQLHDIQLSSMQTEIHQQIDHDNDNESQNSSSNEESQPNEEGHENYNVHRAQIEDPVGGMGLDMRVLPSEIECQGVSIESRIETVKEKLKTRRSAAQYARIINLYLLWLHEEHSEMFHESGCLLCDHHLAFKFLSAACDGQVGRTGKEPPIQLVLSGKVAFKVKKTTTRMSWTNSGVYLSALVDLRENQLLLKGETCSMSLRSAPLIKQWRANLKQKEIELREKDVSECPSSVAMSGSPITLKLQQSTHLLREDTFTSWRNRFLSLAQCFSISRYAELAQWLLSHCSLFSYDKDLPTTGSQKIQVIFVTQRNHKQKISVEDDLKCLIRHRDWKLCPIGSFAFFMAHRFLIKKEKAPDFTNIEWRKLALFRTERSAYQNLSSNSSYIQRIALRDECGAGVLGKVNHLDRHVGALIAQTSGMDLNSIRQWGLWRRDCLTNHYMKWPSVKAIAKMANFKDGQSYFINRQEANIKDFVQKLPNNNTFFDAFVFLQDPTIKMLEEEQKGKDTLEMRVIDVLRYLQEVFYQDCVYLHDYFPACHIFQAHIFQDNWSIFLEWKEFVHSMSSEQTSFDQLSSGPLQMFSTEMESMKRSLEIISHDNERRNGKIDKMLDIVSNFQSNEMQARKRRKKVQDQAKEKSHLITMRPLNEMSLKDLWIEWNEGFEVDGVIWSPLKTLEIERRAGQRPVYFQKHLETTIRRRRQIAEYIELTSLEHVETMQNNITMKLETKCSLHNLWLHIRNDMKNI